MARALTVAEVVAGEAVSGTPEERMADMRAIASVIANRAALLGVTQDSIISAPTKYGYEFNAYNKSLPPGVGEDLVSMAQEQIDYVAENGPVNNATFYATPSAADNLPNGLSYEAETTGHQYFSDPQMRSIGTSEGYVAPNRYAYAQGLDVASVPTPYAPTDLTNNSLMAAFSATPTYSEDPFSSVLGAQQPAINQWDAMAAAKPVSAPMGSVQAQGLLGQNPGLTASATANPMLSLPATADIGMTPGLSASSVASFDTPSSRMGLAEPSFDMSRFDGAAPSVASDFDMGRFADPAPAQFDQSRFGPPSIDVATNTQSFADQPAMAANLGNFPSGLMAQREVAQPAAVQTAAVDTSNFDQSRFGLTPSVEFDQSRFGPSQINPATNTASFMSPPADLGSMPDAYAAQRGPTTGLMSADAQTVQGMAEANLSRAMTERAADPTGIYAGPQTVQAAEVTQPAVTPSLASAYVAPQAVTPAEQAIDQNFTGSITPGLLSPTSIAAANVSVPFSAPTGIVPSQPVQQTGFVDSFPSAVTNNTIEPAAINDVAAAPTLDTMQVSEQPTVAATVDGPANTPATEQQQQITAPANTMADTTTSTAPTTPTTTSKSKGILSGLASPEAAGLGLLGGLALGPAGGLLGALAGQQVARSGGLASMLGGQPATINNIGGGMINTASIWGGGTDPGTQATTSNGGFVTQMPSGLVAVTGPSGTTTGFDSTGKGYAMWGGTPGSDGETTASSSNSGGFFGGLFG